MFDMASWLSQIHTYLITAGVGTSATLFRDNMPDTPAVCMTIYGYAGSPKLYTSSNEQLGRPGLQVKVRHTDSDSAWLWMEQAETALRAVTNMTLSGATYQYIRPVGSAMALGWDANGNFTLVQNFETCRSE